MFMRYCKLQVHVFVLILQLRLLVQYKFYNHATLLCDHVLLVGERSTKKRCMPANANPISLTY